MKHATWLITCVLLMPGVFAGGQSVYQPQEQEIDETYSFENDFEGWTIRSYPSDPSLPPPVTRSQERATDGLTSLKLEVNRLGVFQAVWIEKRFDVEPNQIYDAVVEFSLASRDCCRSVPSYILGGVVNESPD